MNRTLQHRGHWESAVGKVPGRSALQLQADTTGRVDGCRVDHRGCRRRDYDAGPRRSVEHALRRRRGYLGIRPDYLRPSILPVLPARDVTSRRDGDRRGTVPPSCAWRAEPALEPIALPCGESDSGIGRCPPSSRCRMAAGRVELRADRAPPYAQCGTTEEQMAEVAVTMRKHASLNPNTSAT